ncbi:MAG: hypothetical protein Q9226_003061 [Calogaya cf. arnoldii]
MQSFRNGADHFRRVHVEWDIHVSTRLTNIAGPNKTVVGMPKPESKIGSAYDMPVEALWVIDKSIYGMEPGKMVVFRSVKWPGYVLDLHHGEKANGTPVDILQEVGLSDKTEMQKWLLQRTDLVPTRVLRQSHNELVRSRDDDYKV